MAFFTQDEVRFPFMLIAPFAIIPTLGPHQTTANVTVLSFTGRVNICSHIVFKREFPVPDQHIAYGRVIVIQLRSPLPFRLSST